MYSYVSPLGCNKHKVIVYRKNKFTVYEDEGGPGLTMEEFLIVHRVRTLRGTKKTVSVSEPENYTLERNDTDPDTRCDLSPVGQNSTLGTKPRSLLTLRRGNFP